MRKLNLYFNVRGFYLALDQLRKDNKITWKDVATGTGVSASTFTRLGQGKNPDVDSLASLIDWGGFDANVFLKSNLSSKTKSVKYVYFTSWTGQRSKGIETKGNGECFLESQITSIDQIREIEKYIIKEMKLEWANLIEYELLRTEP